MTSAKTTLIDFSWPSDGARTVQISGNWNNWESKEELTIREDGGFHRMIALPENSKVLYKFIVDGNWVTKDSLPTETDPNGNVNNVVHVGPAPITQDEKKEQPAGIAKQTADEGTSNKIPGQASQATHSAAPALVGIGAPLGGAAVANATGTDSSTGNSKADPKGVADAPATTRGLPSHEELSDIALKKSPALAGSTAISGAAFTAQDAVPPGTTSTQAIPSKDISTTQAPSSSNPSSTQAGATQAKLESPPSSAAPFTEEDIKKAMSNPAAAAASVNATAPPAKSAQVAAVLAAPADASRSSSKAESAAPKEIPVTSVPQTGLAATSKESNPTSGATQPSAPATTASKTSSSQPNVPAKDVSRSKSSNKGTSSATAATAATAAPMASTSSSTKDQSSSNQAEPKKALPVTPQTPEKKSSSQIKDGSQTVKEKRGSRFGTLGSSSKRKSNNDLASIVNSSSQKDSNSQNNAGKSLNGANENGTVNGNSSGTAATAPTTPNQNRDRKVSLFGKIKQALSPHSSPSK